MQIIPWLAFIRYLLSEILFGGMGYSHQMKQGVSEKKMNKKILSNRRVLFQIYLAPFVKLS